MRSTLSSACKEEVETIKINRIESIIFIIFKNLASLQNIKIAHN